MTIHVRDQQGVPRYVKGRPLTITVGLAKIPLPLGQSWRITKRLRWARATRQPSQSEIEQLTAHIRTWDGFHANGEPVACTRQLVVGVLTQVPFIRQQVEHALRDLAQIGVIT